MLPSLLALPSPIPLNLKHHPLSLDQINTPELYWSGIMYLKITEQQERTKIGMFNIAILPSLSFHPVPPPPTHTQPSIHVPRVSQETGRDGKKGHSWG